MKKKGMVRKRLQRRGRKGKRELNKKDCKKGAKKKEKKPGATPEQKDGKIEWKNLEFESIESH